MSPEQVQQEATQWCHETLVMDSTCVVVGLGSGVHIAELAQQKKMAKIFVIDSIPSLAPVFYDRYPELKDLVEIIILSSESELMDHPVMNQVIENNLSSVAFVPSWPKTDSLLKNFHRHLSGRSKESLNLFFNKYGIRKDIQIQDESGNRYLNIRDLEIMIQEEVPSYLRLNCFRILKELIL